MKQLLRMFSVLSILLLFAGSLLAPHVSAQRRSVRLYADVVDASDAPILDLKPGDFEVLVGGAKATITKAALAKDPMRIVLLVDTSEQIKSDLNHVRNGLLAFLDAIPPEDEVAFVSTGGQARTRVAVTTDRKKLKDAAAGLFADGGSTVLEDALRENFDRNFRRLENRWPVFVILGTNGPDSSGLRDDQLVGLVQELQMAQVSAHAIMLSYGSSVFNSKAWVASLSVTKYTNGVYESIAAASALPARFKALGETLTAQQDLMSTIYQIDFTTDSKDPQAGIELHVSRENAKVGLSVARPLSIKRAKK